MKTTKFTRFHNPKQEQKCLVPNLDHEIKITITRTQHMQNKN
jgi:hypothetical protein